MKILTFNTEKKSHPILTKGVSFYTGINENINWLSICLKEQEGKKERLQESLFQ